MKMKIMLAMVLSIILFTNFSYAQDKEKAYELVDVMPEYIDGSDELLNFISQKVTYPEKAKKDKIQGRVFVEFIVDKNGSVTEPQVVTGIGGGCNEEAIRVTKLLKFKPGKKDGRAVNVKIVLPFMFKLA